MTEKLTVGMRIRKFIRDLFGSRLVEHLEAEMFQQQSQYEARLNERDREIDRLRQEALRLQAKFDEYELDPGYFWWLAQRGRKSATPSPSDSSSFSEPTSLTWAQIQEQHYRAEEEASKETSNGISNSGRDEELRVEV